MSETFRQNERLTAAKLNRILAAIDGTGGLTAEVKNYIDNQVASIVVQPPPPGLTEAEVTTLINTAIANIVNPGSPTGVVINVDVAAGNATVSSANFLDADTLQVINATVAGRRVNLPDVAGTVAIVNARANTQRVTIVRGTTTYTLAVGGFVVVYLDGSANFMRIIAASSSQSDPRVDALEQELRQFTVTFSGGNAEVIPIPLNFSIVIPAGTYTNVIRGTAAATGSTAYTLTRNGSTVGTGTIGAAATQGNFVVSAATTISGADTMTGAGPATADGTLRGVALSVPYRRVR